MKAQRTTKEVKDIDKGYEAYLKAFENERHTTVGALPKLAFTLQLRKGNKINAGDITFTKANELAC